MTKSYDEENYSAICYLSKEQSAQLWMQIQQVLLSCFSSVRLTQMISLQHFQLLMQTFVLVRFEPSLQFLSEITAQAIVS